MMTKVEVKSKSLEMAVAICRPIYDETRRELILPSASTVIEMAREFENYISSEGLVPKWGGGR